MNWDKLDFYLECSNKSLGLRDQDGLPEYYFQATSYREGLLNEGLRKKGGSINKNPNTAWCPLKNNVNNSFLEVDLLQQFLLCGVSTQGDESHGFTKTFKIQLSSDRIHWHFYQNGTNKVRLSILSNHWRHSYIYRGREVNTHIFCYARLISESSWLKKNTWVSPMTNVWLTPVCQIIRMFTFIKKINNLCTYIHI